MTDLTALQEQVKQVAEARAFAQVGMEKKRQAYSKWEDENKLLLEGIVSALKWVEDAEAKLRELTLAVYQETGEKKPCEGVGVREITKLDYDPKEALAWAMSHQLALSLDKKSFEGFAKATPLPFVTVTTEAQATIATDLSEVLK